MSHSRDEKQRSEKLVPNSIQTQHMYTARVRC